MRYILSTTNVSDLKRIAVEILNKFFPDLEPPKFKIVHNTIPKWLGRCVTKRVNGELTTIIEIQKGILNDEKTLHRVLAHELIHYYLHTDKERMDKEFKWKKYRLSSNPHGKEFKDLADKMNAVYGEDYVTDISNLSYVVESTKEFYIIIEPHTDKKLGVTKSVRPSREQKREIENRIENKKAHVFKSKDESFYNVADIKKYGGYSVFKDEDMQNKLTEMYNSKNLDHLFKAN